MNKNERPIPEAALLDENAVELVRAWVAQNSLHCSLRIGMYEEGMKVPEEKAWGIVLADIARHVAAGIQSSYGRDSAESLARIQKVFHQQLDEAPPTMRGGFVTRN